MGFEQQANTGGSGNNFSDNFLTDKSNTNSKTGGVGYAGTVLQAGADIVSGMMQQKAANAAGNAMYANEGILRRQAGQVLATGLENQSRAVTNTAKLTGSELVSRGASGITAEGTGSSGEQTILEKMRAEIGDIGYQARSQAQALNYQADLTNYQARMTKKAGKFDVLGTTLGIAGGVVGGVLSGSPMGAKIGYQLGKTAGTGIKTLGN